jgi:hypothetical protein
MNARWIGANMLFIMDIMRFIIRTIGITDTISGTIVCIIVAENCAIGFWPVAAPTRFDSAPAAIPNPISINGHFSASIIGTHATVFHLFLSRPLAVFFGHGAWTWPGWDGCGSASIPPDAGFIVVVIGFTWCFMP